MSFINLSRSRHLVATSLSRRQYTWLTTCDREEETQINVRLGYTYIHALTLYTRDALIKCATHEQTCMRVDTYILYVRADIQNIIEHRVFS